MIVPIRRWTSAFWIQPAIRLGLGGGVLACIAYCMWIALLSGSMTLLLTSVAIVPWWWLFGAYMLWLFRSLRRGGSPQVLLVSGHSMALGMDDEGKWVRPFGGVTITETPDEFIIENGPFYMVARLPKDQLTQEHMNAIRYVLTPRGKSGARFSSH